MICGRIGAETTMVHGSDSWQANYRLAGKVFCPVSEYRLTE
jgi:hypothetical protein